jgi:putative DNA-invertase from lambdoid prophage Rac
MLIFFDYHTIIYLYVNHDKMLYAFGYLRVSTEEQTVLNQKIAIRQWAVDNNYEILDFFEDASISGKIAAIRRPGFKEMLEFVKEYYVDAVIVYELSRVGRTFWETLDAVKAVEQFSPLISCSPKESFLQTTDASIRKLMIGILTWVAEREREILIQRTKDGMVRAKQFGKRIGRPKKTLDKNELIGFLAQDIPKHVIAENLGMSKATLYKELKRLSIGSGSNERLPN